MDLFKNGRLARILGIFSFTLIILVLIVIKMTPPSAGYEISIYDAYPLYFWIFLIGVNFSAFMLLIHESFNKGKNNRWILGLIAVLLGNFIFLLLPIFRGYPFIGGASADIFSHIGWIKEIMQSSHVVETNFYPITHIFILSVSDLSGISITTVVQFIPAFFSVIYILSILLLAKTISNNKKQVLLITCFSVPLIFSIFHSTIHPSFLSFIFVPLLLYLCHKEGYFGRKIESTILILILCFLLIFFHPMTTLTVVIIFVTFGISAFILKKSNTFLNHSIVTIRRFTGTTPIIILIISFFAWYTSYGWGVNAIKSIYQNLVYGSDFTVAGSYLSALSMANLTIFQTVRLLILRYGSICIYGGLAFFFLMVVSKRFVFSKKITELEFSYSMQLVAGFIFAGAMIFSNFIVSNPIRSAKYFLMVATVFNGLFIYSILETRKKTETTISFHIGRHVIHLDRIRKGWVNKIKFLPILVIVLMSLSSMVCLCNVYPSPITWQPNGQFTYMNFAGSTWITQNRDITLQISQDFGINIERMEHYINGIAGGNMHMKKEPFQIPTHFGYENNDTLSQIFNYTGTYMITTENGRQAINAFPENVQSKSTQFTSSDFRKLCLDITASRIYDNSEVEIWMVYEN